MSPDEILWQDIRSLNGEQLNFVASMLETNKAISEKTWHNGKSYDIVLAMVKKAIKGEPVLTPEIVEQINKPEIEKSHEIEADAKEKAIEDDFAALAAKVRERLSTDVLYVMIQDVLPAEASKLRAMGIDSLEQLMTRLDEFPDLKDQAAALHARFPNIPIGVKA